MILQTTENIRKVFDEMILIVKSLTGRRCLSGHLWSYSEHRVGGWGLLTPVPTDRSWGL